MNPTERVLLGNTELAVTRLGLGTAPLGGLYDPVSDDQAEAVLHRAWALGVRFFDAAPLYGHGLAEQRLGRALATRRDDVVVATKVGRLLRPDAPPDPTQFHEGDAFYKGVPPVNPVFDFSYEGTLRSLGESRERLGFERIDVAHIHDPDDHLDEAATGACAALCDLRRKGEIGAVGVGINHTEPLLHFIRETDIDCFLLAGRYTLLDQSALAELLPLCAERGIAMIAGGVYNSGILARPEPGARFDYVPAPDDLLERARRLERACERHGVPLMAAAIQFPLGHPAVSCVLTGCRSVEEIEENERMFRREIPDALWSDLRSEGLLDPRVPVPGELA